MEFHKQQQQEEEEQQQQQHTTTANGEDVGKQEVQNKYGSLVPKKNVVHQQQQQYFDSADWQMNRKNVQGGGRDVSEASRLKPAYMMSPSKGGGARGKSKLSSTSLSSSHGGD